MRLLVCKYDSEHGTFRTPPELGKHYREVHGAAPVTVSHRRRCKLCGKEMSSGGVQYHFAQYHDGQSSAGLTEKAESTYEVTPRNTMHKTDEWSECMICGHQLSRKSMANHFQRKHPDADWKMFTKKAESNAVVALAESLPPLPNEPEFAMHEDGNGYVADDFFLPVVNQLALPGGMIPADAMPTLMAYRDATSLMLDQLRALNQRRHKVRR